MKKTYFTVLMLILSFISSPIFAVEGNHVEFLNSKASSTKLPFSEAVRVGNTVYLSGQIGINPKAKKLVKGGIKAETIQTLENIKQSLNKYGYTTNDVVKCMVMLTDIADFATFNAVYVDYFKPPYPARSAFAVKELALGASVEVECMAIAQEKK